MDIGSGFTKNIDWFQVNLRKQRSKSNIFALLFYYQHLSIYRMI